MRVAHSEDEWLIVPVPHVGKLIGIIDDLVEKRDHMNRMASRARPIIICPGSRIGHMALMIGRIKILAIPTAGEEDLGSDAVRTVDTRQRISLRWAAASIIETVEANGLSSEVTSEVPLVGIARDHTEARRKSMQLIVLRSRTLKIVDRHSTFQVIVVPSLRHTNEASILRMEVKLRRPVGAQVLLDGTGRALRVASLSVVHGEAEAIAAGYGVHVG